MTAATTRGRLLIRTFTQWLSAVVLITACSSQPATLPSPSPLGPITAPPTLSNEQPPTATPGATREAAPLPSPTAGPPTQAATAPPSDGTFLILVGDYYFDPAVVTVTLGTTVIWRPVGDLQHTIVSKYPPEAWRGGFTAGSGSPDFDWTFNKPGTYYYHCDYHPGAMDAILTVTDGL